MILIINKRSCFLNNLQRQYKITTFSVAVISYNKWARRIGGDRRRSHKILCNRTIQMIPLKLGFIAWNLFENFIWRCKNVCAFLEKDWSVRYNQPWNYTLPLAAVFRIAGKCFIQLLHTQQPSPQNLPDSLHLQQTFFIFLFRDAVESDATAGFKGE